MNKMDFEKVVKVSNQNAMNKTEKRIFDNLKKVILEDQVLVQLKKNEYQNTSNII